MYEGLVVHLCISRPEFDKYSPLALARHRAADGCRCDLSTSAWILDSRGDDGRLRDAAAARILGIRILLLRRSVATCHASIPFCAETRQENPPGLRSPENAYRVAYMRASERNRAFCARSFAPCRVSSTAPVTHHSERSIFESRLHACRLNRFSLDRELRLR